jgi:hypothetical protein
MKIHNKMKILIKITSIIVIFLMLVSPVAADSISVSVANPTMNFGTLAPDGTSTSISSTVSISSNVNVDFYARANGPLTDAAGDNIPNNPNFQFRIQYPTKSIDSGYVIFDGTNQKLVSNWPKPNTGGSDVATETYLLTVPSTVPFGNYSTTITFTVMTAGIAPASLAATQMSVVDNSTGNVTSNSSNSTGLNTTGNGTNITYTLLTLLKQDS